MITIRSVVRYNTLQFLLKSEPLKQLRNSASDYFTMCCSYLKNFSLFCKFRSPSNRNTTLIRDIIIRFCLMVSCHTISLTFLGMRKGFKNMFHFDSLIESAKIRKTRPKITITTAVAFPFFTIVETAKPMVDTNITSTINCKIILKMGMLIRAQWARNENGIRSMKTMINTMKNLTSHTLYLQSGIPNIISSVR